DQNPGAGLARQVAHAGEEKVVCLAPGLVAAALSALDKVADLGRRDKAGAGGELNAGGGERFGHGAIPSLGSRPPARSSATMSSQPPICSPSMKICGTVRRPCARRIISSRRFGSSSRSILV